MKRTFLFLVASLLLAGTLQASKVSSETASTVAQNFMQRQGVKALLTLNDCGVGEMYLFTASDGGFVLVAGDDCVRPILAYSLTARFSDTLPDHVASWLQGYSEEIALLRSRGEQASPLVQAEWDSLLKADGQDPLYTVVVSPLLTTTWKQGSPYNTQCPLDTLGRDTKVGCVAIALAQVMKYWNHPTQGEGSYSYSYAICGTQSVNFGATTYDWSHMPSSLTSVSPQVNIDAVAQLVYHVGVAAKMKYGHSSSGATTVSSNNISTVTGERALRTYFKYDKALHSVRRDVVGDSLWSVLLDGELSAGRPVIFSGHDTSGGHAFVCDGGNSAGLYHFNWGWGGYCDGYYQLGALNPAPGGDGGNATSHYNLENKMIIGIQPDTVAPGTHTLTALADNPQHGSVTGGGSHAYGDTVTLTAMANSQFRFARWSDGMCYNPRTLIMGGNKSYTAVYDSICGDTVRYDNGLYVASWGFSTARPFYWGMKIEPALLATHTHLDAVEAYLKAGTYRMMVYNGATPSTSNLLDTLSFVTPDEDWRTLSLDSALPVNTSLPLWIVFYNDDITYPACAGTYCGHQLAAYSNTNGTSWNPSSTQRTFLIRGIFHTEVPPEPVYDTTVAEACVSYDWEDSTYTESGIYERLFTASSGADSLRVLVLTIHPAYQIIDTVVACDSFLWLNGVTYTESVVGAEMPLTSVDGCDSVITLSLTLGHSSFDTLVVDTVQSYVWEGVEYTGSGVYTESLLTAEGCDSVKVLVLTIQVGIDDSHLSPLTLRLYPNPTDGIVTVGSDEVKSVAIYDMTGRCLLVAESTRVVDLGELPEGIYTAHVILKDGQKGICRIVKK